MLRPMTPGSLAALAEDNSRDYLHRLTREQRNCAQLHQQHLHLQARILCELYDIADGAFEAAQIRQILEQRQAREDDGFTRLEQANASLDSQLALFRQAQERLVASHSRALAEQRQHPALRQSQQQLQQARQQREHIAADHQPLVDECTGKLAAYSQHRIYTYLRLRQYGTQHYRHNVLSRRMDDWLARQCNFVSNRQNEQLLLAMLEQGATRLATCDQQIAELERQLSALLRSSLPDADLGPLSQETETLARQVITAQQHLKRVRQDIDLLEQCADGDSQDALRWLRYELKTDSLNQALAQWAAIGSPQATRFQQELDELRRRLDSASQRVGQAREVYEQACTFESALGRRLRGDAGCASDCNCNCHTQPSLDDCPCQLRYPLADQYRDDTNYRQLIVEYMNRAQTLNTVLGTISALRLLPGSPNATLSDRPLMQGQP